MYLGHEYEEHKNSIKYTLIVLKWRLDYRSQKETSRMLFNLYTIRDTLEKGQFKMRKQIKIKGIQNEIII